MFLPFCAYWFLFDSLGFLLFFSETLCFLLIFLCCILLITGFHLLHFATLDFPSFFFFLLLQTFSNILSICMSPAMPPACSGYHFLSLICLSIMYSLDWLKFWCEMGCSGRLQNSWNWLWQTQNSSRFLTCKSHLQPPATKILQFMPKIHGRGKTPYLY